LRVNNEAAGDPTDSLADRVAAAKVVDLCTARTRLGPFTDSDKPTTPNLQL
jgi:hypothetical protein